MASRLPGVDAKDRPETSRRGWAWKRSWRKRAPLRSVPPTSTVLVAAPRANTVSSVVPSTCCASAPARSRWRAPSRRDHCAEKPTAVAGTRCRRVRSSPERSDATAVKASPHERAAVAEGAALHRGVHGRVARGGLGVHRPAAPLVHRHVPVGPEGLGREAPRPFAVAAPRAERSVEGRSAAGARLGLEPPPGRGGSRDDLHDAAQGAAPVEVRRPAPQDLEPLDRGARDARPVHPAAEGVVERQAVGEHEGAARPARPEAAQRHALRGRVGGAAAGAPEEREADDLAQRVVDGGSGGRVEGRAGNHGHARRSVGHARVAPGRGHRDLLRPPRGRLLRRVLPAPGPRAQQGGDEERRAGARGQRTVTGIRTSTVPRRHHASRVEQ